MLKDKEKNKLLKYEDILEKKLNVLANNIYLMGQNLAKKESIEKTRQYLNSNEYTRIDAIIFSLIVCQYRLSYCQKNQEISDQINKTLADKVKYLLIENKGCNNSSIPLDTIDDMFDNRYFSYRGFLSANNIDNMSALIGVMNEFEHIVIADIVEEEYIEYNIGDPCKLISSDDDEKCKTEISLFPAFIKYRLEGYICPLEKILKRI